MTSARLPISRSLPRRPRQATLREGGFTLIEVLVAVIVLAIGLVGLATLQGTSIRGNYSAMTRSKAVAVAYDVMDRMRANRDQALLGTGSAYNTTFAATPAAVNCSSPCTSTQLAQYDLNLWKSEVARLPAGEGQVAIDSDNKATVSVRWADARGNGTPLTVSVEGML